MKELVNIHGHTIDKSLLGNGVIIDIGCRGFEFANEFIHNDVFCVDPDPEVFQHPLAEKFRCMNLAVSDKKGKSSYYRNGEMTCLIDVLRPLDHLIEPCETISMKEVYLWAGRNVDVLKLDCEGAEYFILGDENFEPIPKQITVEFHKHLAPELHNKAIESIMRNLLNHYTLKYKHESGMDNLFIRKS